MFMMTQLNDMIKLIINHGRKVKKRVEPSQQRLTTAWTGSYAPVFYACLLNGGMSKIFKKFNFRQYHAEDMSVLAVKHLGWRSHDFKTNRTFKLTTH